MNSELHIKPGKDLAPQIYEFYRNKICFGDYKPGDRLPSYKSLSEKYAISYSPIKAAYQALEREGFIRLTIKGSIVVEQPKTVKENITACHILTFQPLDSFTSQILGNIKAAYFPTFAIKVKIAHFYMFHLDV